MKILILFHYTNKPNLAKNAINSILHQTYDKWELAIINEKGILPLPETVRTKVYMANVKTPFTACLDQAIRDSEADLAIYLRDCDCLFENYLQNLVDWFTRKCKKANYCFSQVSLYDPLTEKPQSPFIYPYACLDGNQVHKLDNSLNSKNNEVSPIQLDLGQIAWKLAPLKNKETQFFHPKFVNIFSKFSGIFGKCIKTNFIGQYKASFLGEEIDLPSLEDFKIAVLTKLTTLGGWKDVKPYLFNLKRFSNLTTNYYFEILNDVSKEDILKDLPEAKIVTSAILDNWYQSHQNENYLLFLDDTTTSNLPVPSSIQPSIRLLQDKKVAITSNKIALVPDIDTKLVAANSKKYSFTKNLLCSVNSNVFWVKSELIKSFYTKEYTFDNFKNLGILLSQVANECDLTVVKIPHYESVPIDWDEPGYLVKYSDVLKAVNKKIFSSGWDHYQKHGKREGRKYPSLNLKPVSKNSKLKAIGPSDWNENLYLQDFPKVKEAIRFGIFDSGWDHFRKSKISNLQSELTQRYFTNEIPTDGVSNYVLATWSGYRRGEGNCESVQYLSTNIRALTKYKHNLSQITIAVPENPEEPKEFTEYLESIPKTIGTAKVVVFRRRNFGQSYGSYCDVYSTYTDQFKYYIFVEDDYVAVEDNFDTTLIHQLEFNENCGYLASLVYDWEGQPHAAVSNGIAKQEVLKTLTDELGCLPHGKNVIGVDYSISSQLQFSWGFLDIGMKLAQISGYRIPYNHAGELRVYNKDQKKDIIVPIQFLKELGYGDLLQ